MRTDTVVHRTVGTRTPDAASAREYLRGSLPAVYRDSPAGTDRDPFVLRFLQALEEVLDPAVATIDQLAAHLDMSLAPPEVVRLVGEWLGIDLDPGLRPVVHRRLVRRATEITRTRGTLFGMGMVLELSCPEHVFEVSDSGGVTVSTTSQGSRPAGPRFVTVVCPSSLHARDVGVVRRVVEEVKPVGVRLDLVRPDGRAA